jgi:prepilin-type N-terminal cleavage/methylation domain-containing protein
MSLSRPKKLRDRGFTLIEVVVSIFVMTVGLMAAAVLAGSTMGITHASKFMSAAGILASEKLEDLNRWDVNDPQICIPTGNSSMGSLSQDLRATVTCPAGSSGTVNYYDDVFMGETGVTAAVTCPIANSCFTETVSGTGPSGVVYTTTYHAPSGIIASQNSSTAPTQATFHRRWVIESQPALNGTGVGGVRRITVQVTGLDNTVQSGVNFQMSLVRP